MGHFIRQGIDPEHERQGAGVVQVLRQQVLAQRDTVQPARDSANQEAHCQGLADRKSVV